MKFPLVLHFLRVWSLEKLTFAENSRRRDLHAVFFGLLLDIRPSPLNILPSARCTNAFFSTYQRLAFKKFFFSNSFFPLRQSEGDFIYVTLFQVPTFLYKFLGRRSLVWLVFCSFCRRMLAFTYIFELIKAFKRIRNQREIGKMANKNRRRQLAIVNSWKAQRWNREK